jgi:hypothetical protein
MGGAKHVHRTARPPRSLPTVGMTRLLLVITLSRGASPSLARDGRLLFVIFRRAVCASSACSDDRAAFR